MNHTNEQSSKNSYSNQEQFCGANPLRSPGKKKEHIGTGNLTMTGGFLSTTTIYNSGPLITVQCICIILHTFIYNNLRYRFIKSGLGGWGESGFVPSAGSWTQFWSRCAMAWGCLSVMAGLGWSVNWCSVHVEMGHCHVESIDQAISNDWEIFDDFRWI
jgi:hypothetical protein